MERFENENFIPESDWNATSSVSIAKVSFGEEKDEKLIQSLEKIGNSKVLNTIAKNIEDIEKHPKLMYGTAILVSTATNKNDDMFLPDETWKARNTPINTPYNENHVKPDIIGHIFDSYVLDSKGEMVADDTKEIPSYFDIAVDFVIYEHIFPNLAKDIYTKASKGETFVSMECSFHNFDYGLLNADGSVHRIIARNKDTSFLTKKLRIYKGEGNYEGRKIVRVLKDIVFTGMGNVDDPANLKSEYKKIDNFVAANCNSINDSTLHKTVLYLTEGNIMKVENLEQAEKLIEDLQKKVNELEKTEANKKVADLESQITKLGEDLKAANTKADLASQELTTKSNKVTELENTLKTVREDLTKKTEALDKINVEAKANERTAQLKELGVEVDDNKKENIKSMTDESFASVLEFVKTAIPQKKQDESKIDETNKAETEAKKTVDSAKEKEDNKANLEDAKAGEAEAANKMKQAATKFAEALRKKNEKKSKNNSN